MYECINYINDYASSKSNIFITLIHSKRVKMETKKTTLKIGNYWEHYNQIY